jgi:hypothetical protein
MIYYHVTDDYLQARILREGLIGQPVVYLAHSRNDALRIRESQQRLHEVTGACVVFQVQYDGEVFIDPHVQPFGAAVMVYADIAPSHLQCCY